MAREASRSPARKRYTWAVLKAKQVKVVRPVESCYSFDDCYHLRWGDAGIPTRSAEPVHQVVHYATPRHRVTLLATLSWSIYQ